MATWSFHFFLHLYVIVKITSSLVYFSRFFSYISLPKELGKCFFRVPGLGVFVFYCREVDHQQWTYTATKAPPFYINPLNFPGKTPQFPGKTPPVFYRIKPLLHQGSGQIIIFHLPKFPWKKGISLTKPQFGVRSCEVAIIWPDGYRKSSLWWIYLDFYMQYSVDMTSCRHKENKCLKRT